MEKNLDGAFQSQLHRRGPTGALQRLWRLLCRRSEEVRSAEKHREESGALERLPQCHPCCEGVLSLRVHGVLPEHHTIQLHVRLQDEWGVAQRALPPCLPGIYPLSILISNLGEHKEEVCKEKYYLELLLLLQFSCLHKLCWCLHLTTQSHKKVIRRRCTLQVMFTMPPCLQGDPGETDGGDFEGGNSLAMEDNELYSSWSKGNSSYLQKSKTHISWFLT